MTSTARPALLAFTSVAVACACAFAAAACTRQETATAPAPVVGSGAPTTIASASDLSAPAPKAASSAPSTATPRFVGRFDRSDPSAVRFAWPGSMIVTRFKGTAISVRLHDDGQNFFQVIIDGEPKTVFRSDHGHDTFPLAVGLPDGIHEVGIYKRTEAKVGETAFLGFEAKSGTLLPPSPGSERRMELIGDSITAGYGNEGPGAICTFNPKEENQYTTYGAIAARALGAEHVTIAWSGKTIGEMTDFYERTLPARADSRWDFSAWVPQLVVMNVGTNNFATYDPGEPRYVRVYTALFDRVRKAYPKALIMCLLGPMLTDHYPEGKQNLTLARRYMRAAMAKIKDSGETNFEYLELPEQNHANGLGCGFHPSLKTHKLMADRVVEVAHARLGW